MASSTDVVDTLVSGQIAHPGSQVLAVARPCFKKHWLWVAALAGAFTIAIYMAGYWIALPMAIALAVLIISTNLRDGIPIALIYSMLFVSLFDNDSFTFNIMGLRGFRLSYPAIILLELCWLVSCIAPTGKRRKVWPGSSLVLFTVFLFIVVSLVYLTYEPVEAKLFALKYWLFVFLPLVIVPMYLGRARDEHLYPYLLSLIIFICIFGFVQAIGRISGGLNLFSAAQGGVGTNPVGFFSERTWFGLLAAFGLPILLFLREARKIGGVFFGMNFMILIVGVILSLSRNAYLGAVICIVLAACMGLRRPVVVATAILVAIVVLAFMAARLVSDSDSILAAPARSLADVWAAATEGNASSAGRLENFKTVMGRYQDGTYSWWGNGFAWDSETAMTVGGAMGAKSNNVFLFVFHIFGLHGLVLIFVLVSYCYRVALRHWRKYPKMKYVFIMITMWLIMAQFAPLHQYGISVMILCVILGMFISGRYEVSLMKRCDENSHTA